MLILRSSGKTGELSGSLVCEVRMVFKVGLNRSRIDRFHCGVCGKGFEENESKVQRPGEGFYRCLGCDRI